MSCANVQLNGREGAAAKGGYVTAAVGPEEGHERGERALISCAGCDLGLPCTVPQGYCRAFTILFPIFTSSVLPTTANGKWLCEADKRARGV